ncbi:unnamed protein product [Thelazia callipaeda]|uniref:LITAF domain-containing protein n=1 Tax=Thelazia callipaeda TaxID=103827 RepID=A0A0N5D7X5_THECL|nr:unnamed protein product [Thelazia callipaeda]
MANYNEQNIPPPPPPYTAEEAKVTSTITYSNNIQPSSQQFTTLPQKYDFPPTVASPPSQPLFMPIMMQQPSMPATPYPDNRPVNVIVNSNNADIADGKFPSDYRICIFCKRGVMRRKKAVHLRNLPLTMIVLKGITPVLQTARNHNGGKLLPTSSTQWLTKSPRPSPPQL